MSVGDLVPHEVASLERAEYQALAAVEAIERVDSPEQAEELLRRITAYQQAVRLAKLGREQERRWGTIRLKAERKMGELLGPAEVGRPRGNVTACDDSVDGAERETIRRARKVAAVPEETFNSYVETAEEPTRAGLLRAAQPPAETPKARTAPSAPPEDELLDAVATLAKLLRKWTPASVEGLSPNEIGKRRDAVDRLLPLVVSAQGQLAQLDKRTVANRPHAPIAPKGAA